MTIDAGLRPLFRDFLPKVHWQAIETGGTGAGVPDLNGCYLGREAWVECKGGKGSKAERVDVRPAQVGWAEARARAGGRVFVGVRRKLPGSDGLWLGCASALRPLREGRKLPELDDFLLLSFQGRPASWDWNRILEVVFLDLY